MKEIDTTNKYMVAIRGDEIIIMNPPRGPMKRTEALVLAATIVALTLPDEVGPTFEEVREAVESA